MASFIYRCPATGQDVQAWIADDAPAKERNVYETVNVLPARGRTSSTSRRAGCSGADISGQVSSLDFVQRSAVQCGTTLIRTIRSPSAAAKRDVFLAEMAAVVPWPMLEAIIEPYYPKVGP
jgi:hypothetical protein